MKIFLSVHPMQNTLQHIATKFGDSTSCGFRDTIPPRPVKPTPESEAFPGKHTAKSRGSSTPSIKKIFSPDFHEIRYDVSQALVQATHKVS